MNIRAGLWVVCCLLAACGDSSGPSSNLQVRVQNQSSAPITVRIGDTDYGAIPAGQMSQYRAVSEGTLDVRLNNVVVASAEFCSGACEFGDLKWTATVTNDGWLGFGIDPRLGTRRGAIAVP